VGGALGDGGRPLRRSRRILVALCVNAALVVAEVVGGLVSHASALLADAGHNLTDVAALGLALFALRWAARPRSEARSFGNHRATILAALANAVALALVTISIIVLAVFRLVHPVPVDGATLAAVAGAALAVNAVAALALREEGGDLNLRAVMAHMVADCLSSACALIAGLVLVAVGAGAERADPAASLAVSALIVVQAYRLIRASVDVLLESTPPDIDLGDLRRVITAVPGVTDVHDVHVWSLSSEVRALSAHLVLDGHPSLEEAQARGERVRAAIGPPFGLAHTTLELECERCTELEDPCGMDDVSDPVTLGRSR
jgi:cobalt-zinc-cadmium efflux system protein